ncbi:hypothetical protein FACS1894153_0420 [Bacteroidia bacterium]|nr:hypothetical protein FACS1894153_0420 [Bacteroidia bacterium]
MKAKPMLPCELAARYNVSTRTLYSWLKEFDQSMLKKLNSKYYTSKQIRYIFDSIGEPEDDSTENKRVNKNN